MTEQKQFDLNQFTGGEERTRYSVLFPRMLLTEGALYVAESMGAYWLMDAISSWQPKALQNEELREIQFWKLTVKDNRAVLTCEIDTDRPIIKQKIAYTDFPLSEMRLWVAPYDERHYSIFLPSEY